MASPPASSAGRWLAQQHVPVLDADQYAHDALAPGAAWQAVIDRWQRSAASRIGADTTCVESRGTRQHRFCRGPGTTVAGTAGTRWCERFQTELQRLNSEPVTVLMIPLLYEAGLESLCTEVWVVHCTAAQQRERLIARTRSAPQLLSSASRPNGPWIGNANWPIR